MSVSVTSKLLNDMPAQLCCAAVLGAHARSGFRVCGILLPQSATLTESGSELQG